MIDLHSHTTFSDGSFSVEELLKEAENIDLDVLSITDHNTVDAYKLLKKQDIRSLFSGIIIPGVEITTTYKGEIIEVLGYGFDVETMDKFLKSNVLTFEQKQLKEYELIKNKYQEIGVIFDTNSIKFDAKKESSRGYFAAEIKKYPENYKFFLNEDSITTNTGFTRNELYNPKSPLYVDESSLFPSLEKIIEAIHESAGVAFLAHTFAYSKNISDELLNIINNYDLDGLECFYTTFTEEQTNYLYKLCKKRKMHMSGGSDFHGTEKKNHNLGIGHGNLNIDYEIIESWANNYIKNIKKYKK